MKYEHPRVIEEITIEKKLIFACLLEGFGEGCEDDPEMKGNS